MLITARKRGLRRLCFHKRLSFCPWGRGVCIQLGLGGPLLHWILQDTVNERSVRILLKCILVFTARKQSLGQGNIFIGVCQEFCSQGEFLPQCMLRYTPPPQEQTPPGSRPPRADTPLGADTPLEAAPPPRADTPPREQTHPWSRHPPQKQTPPKADTPPSAEHAGRYGQCAGGTHPTGMQSGVWMFLYFFVHVYCVLFLFLFYIIHTDRLFTFAVSLYD